MFVPNDKQKKIIDDILARRFALKLNTLSHVIDYLYRDVITNIVETLGKSDPELKRDVLINISATAVGMLEELDNAASSVTAGGGALIANRANLLDAESRNFHDSPDKGIT